jgi:hypothetical protein
MYAILYKPDTPLHIAPNWTLLCTATNLNDTHFRHKLRTLIRGGRVKKLKIMGDVLPRKLPDEIKELLNGNKTDKNSLGNV